jgi:hypothetical protein
MTAILPTDEPRWRGAVIGKSADRPYTCQHGASLVLGGSTAAELYSIQMTMAIGLHIADSTCLRKSGGMGGGGGGGVRKPTAGSD